MILKDTLLSTQNDMWSGYHGDQEYDQLWIQAMESDYQGWIDATVQTVYGTSADYNQFGDPVIAFYHDCTYDPVVEYEFHHFHCGNGDCVYCELVSEGIKYYDRDRFITYDRYIQRWAGDDDVILGYSDLFTWNDPINQETDESDDDESYEEEESYDDDDDYDNSHAYNRYGYNMGESVRVAHFDSVANGWIAPNGTFYYVPDYRNHGCGHWETARHLGFRSDDPVHEMESAGYIHLSSYYSTTYRFHFIPNRPTDEQKNIAQLYCEANDLPLPDELMPDDSAPMFDESEEFTVKVFTYWTRVEDSTLPRAIRDQFYKLSGD